ncbi:MAG: bifunctional alpha,alpha-trehalose-phosphate synthase (UDP-forming)/trehalose-phosphatase [Planctomycetes bacterium]|nr:bifunctional alpha,alpha-trehalose-phosphate synthase (UDP-forming)/trehalose-phosphatase [Planctomycetota bacterium]MBL7144620.1 bifunctional alpha,alpha-trehalose-phosphate synthase (UDP-forming)/trehalose-phosphatase [Phycisphaerae bacterium]
MSRLIIISNRLPVSISRQKGNFKYNESVGGVATGISSLTEPKKRLWFGWPGISSDKISSSDKIQITSELNSKGCHPVFLSNKNIRDFYSGFSNKTIWPLFHYFSEFTVFDENYWKSYKAVNRLFCDEIIKQITKDDIIWVHDYQLMLLPKMIREQLPEAHIGFFLHIPFPSFELLRNLPWRTEILEGILGSDLMGFHEYDYVRHFLSSVYRICGHEHQLNKLIIENRHIRVDAFPMGINYEKYANSKTNPAVQKEIHQLQNNRIRIILSVDRLDYTKGILKRLEAYDWFLTKHPEYREKVSLVMVAVPSRTKVEQYALLREDIEKYVGRINGAYGTLGWTPVSYMYRSLSFEQITAMYNIADVALISPLRDGMNLVAKEFIATQNNKKFQGILILSEMAGAASELSEAIVINPHDKEAVVNAIKDALEMSQEERLRRNLLMLSRISRYTVTRWANDFINSLKEVKLEQDNLATKRFTQILQKETIQYYTNSDKRLILLDYDGTLVPFAKLPQHAKPDNEILTLLEALCSDLNNDLVVVSGRDKETLSEWLGHLPLNLVAEHGASYRLKNKSWKAMIQYNNEWKKEIYPILELFEDRTPGSFIEEKKSALVWHFRKSEPDLAKLRTHELKDALIMMATNLNIGVFEGNKIIEIKPVSINKGQAVRLWLDKKDWRFIFCVGDDYTDEDMFSELPESAVSCKIGTGPSNAKFRLSSPNELRSFLRQLVSK